MPTNSDNNWITINGGKFPATIKDEFINTWAKWELDPEKGFNFNDTQATWQDSQDNGTFRDYVGIGNKKNMKYWIEGDFKDQRKDFDFNAWADSHKDEYDDYRDENGTWYLSPDAKKDLEGRAYTQWLRENKGDVNSTTPVVRIKTGKKEGTQVYYKWDDDLNAYVPHEGKVVYWDTNSGLLKAAVNAGKMFVGAVSGNWGTAASGLLGAVGQAIQDQGGETDKVNLSGAVNQWKYQNGLLPQQQPIKLTEEQTTALKKYLEDVQTKAQEQATSTKLGSGGSVSLGSVDSSDTGELLGTAGAVLGGVGLASALMNGLTTSGNSTMADSNNNQNSLGNLIGSLTGLGVDGYNVYRNYKDQKTFGDLFNQWSNTAGNLVNKSQNLSTSLQNLYDKKAGDTDKFYEALKEKIKVPTRNGDEWQSTPYYTTATQGSQNVNNAFAKALNAADTINQTWTDLGKAKMYGEDDVYDTYRKFANARTQLADRAAALTDSRTYASNRGNGVGTSSVQAEAQAENARKYMADLANIDSQAYTDALSYVQNLSKLQTDQRNAAIAEAVNALNPTIATSTTDASNQLKNSQNEIGALWYGDKAADLERGWLAQSAALGQQGQNAILSALVGLNANNVNGATNLAGAYAGAYGQAMNALGQSVNKTGADVASSANNILSLLGMAGKGVSSLWDALSGSSNLLVDGLTSVPDTALGLIDGFNINLGGLTDIGSLTDWSTVFNGGTGGVGGLTLNSSAGGWGLDTVTSVFDKGLSWFGG